MISLMSDSRIVFLIWFVSVAIVVAMVLIFIEIRLKKKRVLVAAKRKERTPIDKMRSSLAKNENLRENLDLVGNTAKIFFKSEYGLSIKLSYAELVKEFEKRGNKLEAEFCEEVFEAYYSDNKLMKEKIGILANTVEEIYQKKKAAARVSSVPGFWSKVSDFFRFFREGVMRKIGNYVAVRNEKLERATRSVLRQDYEYLKWVRQAIRLGYDKAKVFSLLIDESWDKRKAKKVLKVYDKEVAKVPNKSNVSGKGGVAYRIVQKEKDWLEKGTCAI